MPSNFNEALIIPIIVASILGFVFICKHIRYGFSRSISILLWGFVHLIPMILALTAGSDSELNHNVIWMGYFSLIYMTIFGVIFMVIAFVPAPDGEYFADGPNWPV